MNRDTQEGDCAEPMVALRVGRMEESRSWYSSVPSGSQVTFTLSLGRRGAMEGGTGETVGTGERDTWERRMSWEDSTSGFSSLQITERRHSEAESEWVERRRSSWESWVPSPMKWWWVLWERGREDRLCSRRKLLRRLKLKKRYSRLKPRNVTAG